MKKVGEGLTKVVKFFAARCHASAAYVVMRCLSVRLCLSRTCTMSKRINTHHNFFTFG